MYQGKPLDSIGVNTDIPSAIYLISVKPFMPFLYIRDLNKKDYERLDKTSKR